MTWDKGKPSGSLAPSVGDDDIRANMDHLDRALGAEHDFPGSSSAGPRRHKFPRGTLADRNALVGMVAGSLFVRTDTVPRQVDEYDGAAWAATGGLPPGGIIMWSGAIGAIPAGYLLCDGTGGTPDLRGRFIVGYESRLGGAIPAYSDADYNTIHVGTSGEKTHTLLAAELPAHTHPISDPTHAHTVSGTKSGNDALGVGNFSRDTAAATSSVATGITVLANTGGGGAHENRPPYYVLAFIMKT